MTEEVGALHEAMAGLHGEMGAVQRELDNARASQDKLTTGARVERGIGSSMHGLRVARRWHIFCSGWGAARAGNEPARKIGALGCT